MDPRMAKAQVSEIKTDSKVYSVNNHFTVLNTTGQGHVAVGSATGDLRLFTKVGQNAKNLFPGFGDPIIAIDSTKDGKYLLATCSKYLILLPTFSNGVDGFSNTILNKDKKVPIKLTLTPTDIYRYKIKNLDFKPAKFDENKVKKENFIITCTGKYTIVWSMS